MEFNRGLLYHVESLEQDDTYGDYGIFEREITY